MNLFKTDLLALWAAFDSVEGDGFFAGDIRRKSPYSILGAINWCRDQQDEIHQEAQAEWDKDKTKDYLEIKRRITENQTYANVCIYGAGGYHRYYIRINGDIEFLDSFALAEGREKARKAGFKCR